MFTNVNESLKSGDTIKVYKNNDIRTTEEQDSRAVYDVTSADKIQTNVYQGVGIDEVNYKPLSWAKQKVDKILGGEYVYKLSLIHI